MCERLLHTVRLRSKPSLFQHVGMHSSLTGKIQKAKVRTAAAPTAEQDVAVSGSCCGGDSSITVAPLPQHLSKSTLARTESSIDFVTGFVTFFGWFLCGDDSLELR